MNPADVLALAREKNVKMVDLRFCDLLGTWQHFSVPIEAVSADTFEDGLGFDGSSIRGWKTIDQSDMIVVPDASTAWIDPFYEHPTLVLSCNVLDCITRQPYERDPRNVARHAEAFDRGDVEAVVADYAPDAVLFTPEGPIRGHAALRAFFAGLLEEFCQPGVTFDLFRTDIEDDVAFIAWTAETRRRRYELGTDTFIVRGGKIVRQTFAARVVASPVA